MAQETMKYAVVDLEATGTGAQAKIIQVGIVILEQGHITKTYETEVNPHEPLDQHIQQLTGLTDKQLRKAPEFSQVAPKIYNLIQDAIFVAHNVKFDANLLAEALFWEGFELLTPRVDTVELAQVFFPTFEKYNLGILCEQLDIPLKHAHTAISDAVATAQLFLRLQEKMKSLPKALLERLLDFSDALIYETHLAIKDVWQKMPDGIPNHLIERHGLFLQKIRSIPKAKRFSHDFSYNLELLGLEERTEQALFASFVEEALQSDVPSFLQAKTGIGKTYAYLLPLLAQTDQQIVVSVPTKLLQDQIMKNEGARLEQVFQISLHSLKSPRNYLKLDALYASLLKDEEQRLTRRCKMQLLIWLTETKTGDLDEIGQAHRYEHYFQTVRHDGKLSETSLFPEEDFWNKGQKSVKTSRILVTNHAYFLTRLEDDPSLVENKLVVIDEAQKLLLALENHAQKEENVITLLQEIQSELEGELPLLTRRLLESIQFSLNQAVKEYQLCKKPELSSSVIHRLKQDVSELPQDMLPNLHQLFSEKYEQFCFRTEVFEDHHKLYLLAASLELLHLTKRIPDQTKLFFISATLEISSKVSLADLFGFTKVDFYKIPVVKTNQQACWVLTDGPAVSDLSVVDYAQWIVEWIDRLAKATFPVLILFTSKELLLAVSQRLELPHLAQYKNGDVSQLKRRFDKGESRILLGAASFWDGVDFADQTRMIHIITRLPFDNPRDLLTQKVNQRLREEGKHPFYDYNLPMAILRMKQALGRTVRTKKQYSAVLCLDNRVTKKRYGKQILKALEEVTDVYQAEENQVAEKVLSFLNKSLIEKENE